MSVMPQKKPNKKKAELGPGKQMTVSLAGMNYRVDVEHQRMLAEKTPILVDLVREPTNLFDRNAIKVVLKSARPGLHVGYVARGVAASLALLIDQGKIDISAAFITEIDPDDGSGELLISFRQKIFR